MCSSRKIFKQKLKFCQNNQDLIKMNSLASKHKKEDFKGFWKETKKLSSRSSVPVSIDGIKVNEPRDIANIFKSLFQVEATTLHEPLNGNSGEAEVSSVSDRITAKDVAKVIKRMTRGKSPGHDGLSVEHFQHAENMKKYARNQLLDKLHRGGVLVCIGLTLYGSVLLGDHFYKYFKYVRPQIEASKAAAERELLAEGSSDKILLKD